MKRLMRRCVILLPLFICSLACHGLTVEDSEAIGLPMVIINTVDAEEPTCDYVEPPVGGGSLSIANATKVPGSLIIKQGEQVLYESGDYVKGESGMTVRIRGNTSAYLPKKPYKVKLQKKADLLLRDDDNKYKDKDWLLLKDGDITINNMIGFMVNELVGLQWTPSYKYVELIMNGDYRGIYMLCESVKRNTDCRIDVDKDGLIAEYDAYWWNEDVYLDSSIMNLFKYTFKYPEDGDMTEEILDAIKTSLYEMESSIVGGDYAKHWDVNSLVKWVLAQDILGNSDGWGSNIYFTKYSLSDESKYKMANLWDFDMIMNTLDRFSSSHTKWIYEYLTSDEDFMKLYKEKWVTEGRGICEGAIKSLQTFKESQVASDLEVAREQDAKRWDVEYTALSSDIENSIKWFESRLQWMNSKVGEAEVTSIEKIYQNSPNGVTPVFNLKGQRVSPNKQGLYIMNGRKFICN